MTRQGVVSGLACFIVLGAGVSLFAQQPVSTRAEMPEVFFRENWKDTPEVPVTQDFVLNSNLDLNLYQPNAEELLITGGIQPPHIWTGMCTSACAVTLAHKGEFADLTGRGKIRWLTKVSGFHQIRPLLKLADGTWLVGDHVDAYNYDWHESEFFPSEITRWLTLDIENVYTRGTWIENPDLSKVDEIGFVDLMPGSGHGQGGWSDVAWIEVYAQPVAR